MVDAGDLTCSQSSLEANFTTNLSYPLEYSLRVLQIVYAFVILIGGILLNTFAAFLIVKTNTLRTHSFFVAVQLCLSNVVLAIFFSLPVIISNIADEWMMPTEICIASGFVIFSLTTLRNALIFVLILDRFTSVFLPFWHSKWGSKVVSILCLVSWVLSLLYSLLAIPQILDCYIFSSPVLTCLFSYRCSKKCQYFTYFFILSIIVPTLLLSVIFLLALFIKGRIISYKQFKLTGKKDKKLWENQWRAIKTLFFLLLALVIILVPAYVIANIANSFGPVFHRVALQISLNAIFILVITDSIIVMRNADFREGFVKFLHRSSQYWTRSSQYF